MFVNTSEAIEDIAFSTIAEMGHDKRADTTLQTFHNSRSEHYCIKMIVNTELSVCDAKHFIVPKFIWRRIIEWYHNYLQHPRQLEGDHQSHYLLADNS